MDVDRPLTFFGRDDELSRLDTLLDEHENVLLLNGIGGIGKTTVAKEYYHRYATKYDSLIWLDYRESLFDSFMSQKMQSYFHIIKLAQSAEEAFMGVVKTLSQIEGNNLFVIDNLSNINDFIKYERYLPKNWKYLVTSRSNIEEYEPLYLDRLDEESAKKLFYKYYKFERDDETLIKIFQRVAYHTLTIEMIAKSYNKSKEKLSKAYDDLKKLGINLCDIEVRVEHNIDAQKEIKYTIEKYLKFIFDTSTLQDKQTLILKQFLMLPTKTIFLDEFITYTGFDRSECINTLEDIQEMGWIKNEQNGYYLHQILKEVLLSKIEPSFEEVKYLVEYFKSQMYVKDTENPMYKVKYIDYGIAIFDVLSKKEDRDVQIMSGTFANQIGILNYHLGDYPKALEYYQKSLAIREKVLGLEHPNIAQSYNNIGELYRSMGDYPKALEYHQKSLAVFEKVLGVEHPDTATSYNNIGLVYKSMGDYPKALEYYQKDLAISEKVLGKEHPFTAISYNNIGLVYESMGDYPKALEYHQKSLAIKEKVSTYPNLISKKIILQLEHEKDRRTKRRR
jgi:tetratricopeptide (TPR) repeat protein